MIGWVIIIGIGILVYGHRKRLIEQFKILIKSKSRVTNVVDEEFKRIYMEEKFKNASVLAKAKVKAEVQAEIKKINMSPAHNNIKESGFKNWIINFGKDLEKEGHNMRSSINFNYNTKVPKEYIKWHKATKTKSMPLFSKNI